MKKVSRPEDITSIGQYFNEMSCMLFRNKSGREEACLVCEVSDQMSLVVRKPIFGVSDQVLHKPGCTTTEDSYRLEISDLGSRVIVLSV